MQRSSSLTYAGEEQYLQPAEGGHVAAQAGVRQLCERRVHKGPGGKHKHHQLTNMPLSAETFEITYGLCGCNSFQLVN